MLDADGLQRSLVSRERDTIEFLKDKPSNHVGEGYRKFRLGAAVASSEIVRGVPGFNLKLLEGGLPRLTQRVYRSVRTAHARKNHDCAVDASASSIEEPSRRHRQ